MKERGIVHQVTTRADPEDNGRAERYGRTLVEMARCMLIQAGLPIGYWAEAIYTACYLKNRLLHTATLETPYARWFGHKPDLSNIRTFGCLCYVKPSKDQLRKLSDRGIPCILMGYSDQNPAYYRVMSLGRSRRFFTARNVVFDEAKFHNPDTGRSEKRTS